MIATSALKEQNVWLQKPKYDLAEKIYYEKLAQLALNSQKAPEKVRLVEEIPKAVQPQEKTQEVKKSPANKQECPEKLQKGLQNSSKKEKVKNEIPPDSQVVAQDPAQTGDPSVEFELTIKCNSKKPKKVKKDRKKNNKNNVANNENVAEINAVNVAKGTPQSVNTLAGEVAKAREHIKNSMQCIDNVTNMTTTLNNSSGDAKLLNKVNQLEKNNAELKQELSDMKKMLAKFEKLEIRVVQLEKELASSKASSASKASQHSPQTKGAPAKPQDDDDDGVDLFASDSEDEDAEAAKIKEQRLAEYAARKSKKPVLIAKSNIILDVKPWDDETDMKVMEERVRKIATDGLVWGASKLVPLAYGIHKLQISCVVEDDKVSVDWLQETIEEIEDYVQSVDIAAFNKV